MKNAQMEIENDTIPHMPLIAITSVPWAEEAQDKHEIALNSVHDEDDLRGLLAEEGVPAKNASETTLQLAGANSVDSRDKSAFCICMPCEKIGNCTIFMPNTYRRTQEYFGIVGPRWYGSLCTLVPFWFVAGHPAIQAFNQWWSFHHMQVANSDWKKIVLVWFNFATCVWFLCFGTVHLILACCSNPGIVTEANSGYSNPAHTETTSEADTSSTPQRLTFNWCDICSVHQPQHAKHCPECNLCVANYDHHCHLTGLSIGKLNMKHFVEFSVLFSLYLFNFIRFVPVDDPQATPLV